jgi:hypothetical protein
MSCPTDELLRAHVDVADDRIATHVDGCGACADRLAAVADDARFAAGAVADLDADAPSDADVDAAAAWHAVGVAPTPTRGRRLPVGIAAGVVALLVVGLVALTPTGRQAAADLLASFRSERLEVVTFDPDQPLAGIEGLAEIVEVDADLADRPAPIQVDDLDAAAEVSGFVPAAPASLPDGAQLVDVEASPPSTTRLTFRADKAPDLPPALDGAQLIVSLPGTVGAIYEIDEQMLVIAEAGELGVDAQGAGLDEIRGYLLSRPEVPDDVARQLLAIDDWTTTLPIPVPVDRVVWQETTVDGASGLMVSDPMGSGLLWHADGRIHAIGAEGLDVDALRRVADGLG